MKRTPSTPAPDFTTDLIDGTSLRLSDFRGKKILLAFFRNGACAMCNLRVHELIEALPGLHGLQVVAVFESPAADMIPYVGRQQPPFPLVADPEGVLYTLYGLESSEEKINAVIQSGVAHARTEEAARHGFPLQRQENANFFRLPAEFLIDEDFRLAEVHYSDQVIDHLPLTRIQEFAQQQSVRS